jgi:hypothetical protein
MILAGKRMSPPSNETTDRFSLPCRPGQITVIWMSDLSAVLADTPCMSTRRIQQTFFLALQTSGLCSMFRLGHVFSRASTVLRMQCACFVASAAQCATEHIFQSA